MPAAVPTAVRTVPPTALRRGLAAGALLSAVALTASGCGAGMAARTNATYQPGEGAIATVGDVAVRNLVLVADGKGAGVLLGSITMLPLGTNAPPDADPPGDELMAAQAEGSLVDVKSPLDLPPASLNSLVALGVDQGQVPALVNELEATPGRVVPVTLRFRDAGDVTLDVVVVDNKEGPYEGIKPPVVAVPLPAPAGPTPVPLPAPAT